MFYLYFYLLYYSCYSGFFFNKFSYYDLFKLILFKILSVFYSYLSSSIYLIFFSFGCKYSTNEHLPTDDKHECTQRDAVSTLSTVGFYKRITIGLLF